MRRFNSTMVERFLTAAGIPEDEPIESKMVTNAIRSAQTQVEAQNFEIRKNVLKYDDVLNRQRTVIYDERRKVLEGADLRDQVLSFVEDTLTAYVTAATAEGFPEDWDLQTLWAAVRNLYPVGITIEQIEADCGGRGGVSTDYLIEELNNDALARYQEREESLGAEVMRELERRVVLSVLDRKWREHLYEMDYLQEGIGLRAMAQRDPLVEYQREGYDLFMAMLDAIKEETVGFVFHADVQIEEQVAPKQVPLQYSAPSETGGVSHAVAGGSDGGAYPGTPRNAACPCGSGRKYKRCHGAAE